MNKSVLAVYDYKRRDDSENTVIHTHVDKTINTQNRKKNTRARLV